MHHRSEGGFDRSRYDVEAIPDDRTAATYIKAHHSSRSSPSAPMRFGLYERGGLVGVVVLSVPSQAEALTDIFPQLLSYQERLVAGTAPPRHGGAGPSPDRRGSRERLAD